MSSSAQPTFDANFTRKTVTEKRKTTHKKTMSQDRSFTNEKPPLPNPEFAKPEM
jgi:hypothetical protein